LQVKELTDRLGEMGDRFAGLRVRGVDREERSSGKK